ncbi:hypothetical protein OSTOST_09282 [Ostertagia ostertagi]
MNSGGRVGLSASSSREDPPRSRNTSARRTFCNPQDGAIGVSPSTAVRGNGGRRRWAYKQEPPPQVTHIACTQNNQNPSIARPKTKMFSIVREGNIAIGDEFAVIEERNPLEENYPCFPGFINTYTQKAIARSRREKERCEQLAACRSQDSISSRLRSTIPSYQLRSGISWPGPLEVAAPRSGIHHWVHQASTLKDVSSWSSWVTAMTLKCLVAGLLEMVQKQQKGSKVRVPKCVRFDDNLARKAAASLDGYIPRNNGTSCNTLGLEFILDGETVDVAQPVLVDMAVAPVDSDVTCVLYVTAESRVTGQGISSMCNVVLQPMSALCTDDDDFEVRNSPIYNIQWSVESSAIYSCAWNSNKTRIALGMEESAKITDVITEKSFTISSRRRNVISQHFAPDGNLIYMGLRDSDVILSDLRMKSHHVTGSLKGSRSSGWIRQLRSSYPQCVLIENFRGELKLYDSRRCDRELMSFSGHRNTHFRLPCTVDCQENFVFAVGSDGCTRGWSLASGDLLCAVPCPRPVDDRTDFPRVVYSSAWGGRAGSSALVLAVGDSLRIHHLEL